MKGPHRSWKLGFWKLGWETARVQGGCGSGKARPRSPLPGHTHQVIIRPDAEEFPEIAEGHGCVGLEPEVLEVVSGGEIAALTAGEGAEGRRREGQAWWAQAPPLPQPLGTRSANAPSP